MVQICDLSQARPWWRWTPAERVAQLTQWSHAALASRAPPRGCVAQTGKLIHAARQGRSMPNARVAAIGALLHAPFHTLFSSDPAHGSDPPAAPRANAMAIDFAHVPAVTSVRLLSPGARCVVNGGVPVNVALMKIVLHQRASVGLGAPRWRACASLIVRLLLCGCGSFSDCCDGQARDPHRAELTGGDSSRRAESGRGRGVASSEIEGDRPQGTHLATNQN